MRSLAPLALVLTVLLAACSKTPEPGKPAIDAKPAGIAWIKPLDVAEVDRAFEAAKAKNQPVFRIVVTDGRSPRDGKFIEELGTYHPRRKTDNVKFDLERAKYWISKGAQPSDTVASFIKQAGKAAAAAA
jgi:small subunit ribosomal protein S16